MTNTTSLPFELQSAKIVNTNITKMETKNRNFMQSKHELALQCLGHAAEHGDFTLLTRYYQVLKTVSKTDSDMLKSWITKYAPAILSSSKDKEGNKVIQFKKDKNSDEKDFDIDGAVDNPYFERDIMQETIQKMLSRDSINKRLTGIIKDITQASEGGSDKVAMENEQEKQALDLMATKLQEMVDQNAKQAQADKETVENAAAA